MGGGQTAFDIGSGINRQRTFGNQFAMEFSPDDRVTDDALGVENVAFELNDERALGFEVFGEGAGDAVIVQVHVLAAPLAHRGFGGGWYDQFGAAFEAGDVF